jgi:tRNA A-37 threonylcarbamoyl transferase component Bud32
MEKLQKTVEKLISERAYSRTFSFDYNGEKLWVKQPEMGEANIWHRLLLILSKLVKNNFFKPTVVTDPKASLIYEAKKISSLRQNNIPVPEIVLHNEHYLLLKDAGLPLSLLLNTDEITFEEKVEICKKLSTALADMHNRNFYHSRPALRDITYKEGKIYFMDFEESLETTLTLEEAILRDGFIFVHALYRKLYSPELISITLESYHRSLRPDLWDRLVTEGRRYIFTYFILRLFKRFLGKDGIAIYQTLHYFKQF